MIAEGKAIKAQLEAEETVVEFVEKVGPDGRTLVLLPIRRLQKNCKSNLELRLINVIFKYKLRFERLV